jgi:ubiquinone/menaquinone biosynthesis C-methylase UbiE
MLSASQVDVINESTKALVGSGQFILQAHRFGDTEVEHAKKLLHWADIPPGAAVVDLGSGTGAVPYIWSKIRDDLSFCLVNLSEFQLGLLPKFCDQICCDMENVPVEDGAFDAAVCMFSIGHTDHATTIAEMSRIVKPGGIVFVYDMVGKSPRLSELFYSLISRDKIEVLAASCGLSLDFYMEPADRGCPASKMEGFDEVFGPLRPAIWRWVKRGEHVAF